MHPFQRLFKFNLKPALLNLFAVESVSISDLVKLNNNPSGLSPIAPVQKTSPPSSPEVNNNQFLEESCRVRPNAKQP